MRCAVDVDDARGDGQTADAESPVNSTELPLPSSSAQRDAERQKRECIPDDSVPSLPGVGREIQLSNPVAVYGAEYPQRAGGRDSSVTSALA